ncbi:hypothetical protein NDU88_009550 [Pleurodeles waltl]|uniref:Uncharacterized protein n=1 Tax=Pleurodeles waltl TaxID=8319 RepID=A0AAV7P2J7_PLEWA|nr:hypothetical protein NDU88_009550 [Pleurodeles waltl]
MRTTVRTRTMVCDVHPVRGSLPVFCVQAYHSTHAHYDVLLTTSVADPSCLGRMCSVYLRVPPHQAVAGARGASAGGIRRLLLELGERVRAGVDGKNCGAATARCPTGARAASALRWSCAWGTFGAGGVVGRLLLLSCDPQAC